MRWTAVLMAALIASSGCGSTTDERFEPTGPATTSSETIDETVDTIPTAVHESATALVTTFGDEHTALAAVLLAAERGYGANEIVAAGLAERLQIDGLILTAQGTELTPEFERIELFDDTDATTQAAGLKAPPKPPTTPKPPKQYNVNSVVTLFDKAFGEGLGALVTVMALFTGGYSPEQVVTAVLTNGRVGNQLELIGADGEEITPERSPSALLFEDEEPEPDFDDEIDFSLEPMEPATTAAPTSTLPADDESGLAEMVDRAVGTYALTDELSADLLSMGDVVGIESVTGEFVVNPDGTVTGSLTYTIHQGYDGEVFVTTEIVRTFPSAALELVDDRLTFETQATMVATWNGDDAGTYYENVTGVIDLTLNRLAVGPLSITDTSSHNTVAFQRP